MFKRIGEKMHLPLTPNLEDKLRAANYRPSGFDYMRFSLATLVVVTHTINVCYGKEFTAEIWRGPWRGLLAIILPMFFALSGFLIAGSMQRCRTLISFLGLRAIRLVPALAVDTIIGALLIGTIFTTLPITSYLNDPEFSLYFLNILGHVHYNLPGVFEYNPWEKSVNQQLWTLPYEMLCYASLAALAFIGATQKRVYFLAISIAINVAIFAFYEIIQNAPRGSTVSPPVLVQCFLYGIGLYLYRDRIPWSGRLASLSFIASIISLLIPGGDYFSALPIVYLTAYIGLMQPKRTKFLESGDYSYGIFLYGFPIQQAVVASLSGVGSIWYVNLAIAYPITLSLAVLSWWFVEKPALRLRPRLIKIEDVALKASPSIPGARFILKPMVEKPRTT